MAEIAKTTIDPKDKKSWKGIVKILVAAVLGILLGTGTTITVKKIEEGNTYDITVNASKMSTIELAEEQTETKIETAEGDVTVIEAPTVESVDGNKLVEECSNGEECGQGWYVDVSTPQTFRDAVYGQCIDTDGHYGSQCWDEANLFWQNYAGRSLSTCGTGAAKGTLNCWEQNAGNEFEMVWDATQVKTGDIVVFNNGQFGHIGMAMGDYNNGYVALLGTNQGGIACPGGGSAANIINISMKYFAGAFRPKAYIQPEPTVDPVIPITGCIEWHVAHGDTMSKIMVECEGFLEYGEVMNNYAKSWYSRIVKPGQSVYDGWHSKEGVGLYANDWIDHLVK